MSKFAPLQKEECNDLLKEEAVKPIVCPTCIPDTREPKRDWLTEKAPYKDLRTCEYINKFVGLKITQIDFSDKDLREYAEIAKEEGVAQLLRHFNKLEDNKTIALLVDKAIIPKDGIIVDDDSFIKIKIVVSAVIFDPIPAAPLTEDDEPPVNNTDLPGSMEINDSNFDFFTRFATVMIAIQGYDLKYSYFRQIDEGALRYDIEDQFVLFSISQLKDEVKELRKQMNEFVKLNDFEFMNLSTFFSLKDKVQKFEIEFDNSDPEKPLKINKVYVTSQQCPKVELKIGLDAFKKSSYMPTALYFLSNFQRIYEDISAEETRDWLEFFTEYVYPPIKVDYGDGEGEELVPSGLSCLLDVDLADILKNALEDFAFTAMDVFEFEFGKNTCSDIPEEREPSLKQFLNPKKQKVYEKEYKRKMAALKKQPYYAKKIKEYSLPLEQLEGESSTAFNTREKKRKKALANLNEHLGDRATETADKKIRDLENKNPDYFKHPYAEQFQLALKAKTKSGDSILSIFKELEKTSTSGDLGQDFLNTIGLCGFTNGLKKATSCLLKQVSYEQAIKSAVSAIFAMLPIDSIEEILFGLPPQKQIEIRQKVEKEFGSFKPPWEMNDAEKEKTPAQREQEQAEANTHLTVTTREFEIKYEEDIAIQKEVDALIASDDLKVPEGETRESAAFTIMAKKSIATREQQGQSTTSQDISEPTSKVINAILEAYLEALLELLGVDELIQAFKEHPAIGLIIKAFKSVIKCPSKVMKDIKNLKLKEFKIDACNPSLPILPKMPKIELFNPFKIVKKSLIAAIREALAKVISSLINKFLSYLEGSLCGALEVLGKAVLNPWDFFQTNALQDCLREAFCPDASNDDVKELANNLLNKIGAKDGVSSAMDCLSGALLGIMSLSDMRSLMLDPSKNPALLDRVIEAISVGCPRFADMFNNRPRVKNFFVHLGNLIPPSGRERLRALDDTDLNVPIYNSICLTSEELSRWDELRRNNLQAYGLSPQDAASQVELYNNRAQEALQDLLGDLNQNPNQAFLDALNDLMGPTPDRPPGCELGPGESMFGSKALKEPQEVVKLQDDISDKMFDILGDSFKREFSNNPNPFDASIISKILSDTRGNSQEYHRFLESFFITDMDYHDSERSQKTQEDAPFWKKPLGGLFNTSDDRGYFPTTIGEECRVQITEDRNYKVSKEITAKSVTTGSIKGITYNKIKLETEKPDFEMKYSSGGIVRLDSVSYVSDLLTGATVEDFSYKSLINSSNRGFTLRSEINLEPSEEIKALLINHTRDNSLKYKNSVFNYFLNSKMSAVSIKPTFETIEVYKKTSEKLFNEVKNLCAEESSGFLFGFEDEDLTEDELTYVGPDGEEPYEDFYTEEDSVLGRAKAESDRVTFLNPEEYGGSYTVPPIYIAPKDMKGWLKISKVISPDEEECEPKSENILRFSEIKKSINDVRNSMKIDPRVGSRVEKCFVEKPFDKIISKNAVAGIDGIVKMHLRMKVVEEFTRSLPILANVEYSKRNFDMSNASLVLESLIKDLKAINPFGLLLIEKNNYYILILEQAFQSYYRSTIEKLPDSEEGGKDLSSLPKDVQAAISKILEIKEKFSYENIQIPEGKVSLNLFGSDSSDSQVGDKDLSPLPENIQIPEAEISLDFFGTDLPSPRPDSNLLTSENFMLYALAYQKYGEAIFTSTDTITYTPVNTFFLFKEKKNLLAVIFAIRLVEKECKLILKEMLFKEYEEVMNKFYEEYQPKIKDIGRFLLTSKNIFMDNKISSFGTYIYEQKVSAGSYQSIGQAEDISDTEVSSPWGENTSDDILFKIERYVRIIEKDVLEVSPELQGLLENRDHNLRGVVNIENLQNFFEENKSAFGEYNLTDIFGTAVLGELEEEYTGDIGLKYGLRIIMKLPSSSISFPRPPILSDLATSRLEKTYYCDIENLSTPTDISFSIPICFAEVDIKDQPIESLNLLSGEGSYDLDCLARKLSNSTDFELFFNMIIPIQASSSLVLNYSNLFFLRSIGIADGWDDDAKEMKVDSDSQFKHTKGLCRKFFASFYNSNRFVAEFNLNLPKLEFPDFFKLLFGGFELPSLNINLLLPDWFKFDHKVIKQNPFDKNKELCEEDVDKLF